MKVLAWDSTDSDETNVGMRAEATVWDTTDTTGFTMNVLSSNTLDARIRIAMPSLPVDGE